MSAGTPRESVISGPPAETLADLVEGLESGRLSSVFVVRACLERINRFDAQVKAWVLVDSNGALAAAEASDQRRAAGKPLSRLDGIPLGVKDIIDVQGWPTVAGFEPWRSHIAARDAKIVELMRRAGLIPLGKTVTTQFASIDPPETRNPWDLSLTPGGSSSGSCAAVACGMVPLALGSQTGGSINRPASFCGVTGLKLAFNHWPVAGVVPCSPSLDTLGPIVNSPRDLPVVLETIAPLLPDGDQFLAEFKRGLELAPNHPATVLRLGGRFESLADPEMKLATEQAATQLISGGCEVSVDPVAAFFDDHLWATHRTIMMRECFITHESRFKKHPDSYLPKVRGWVEAGRAISDSAYGQAQHDRGGLLAAFSKRYADIDALLAPAALGVAPMPETTGDPVFNSPWTLLGVPSLSLPVAKSGGLPLGIQLVASNAGPFALGRLLSIATLLKSQSS